MKQFRFQVRSLAATALCAIVLGCSGNGTDVSSGGGGSAAIVGSPQIEMVYIPGLNQTSTVPTFGDPLNIRTGEQVQFQLVGYTATGQRVVLPSADWITSDLANTYGSISGNTGIFTASSRQSTTSLLVTTRYNGSDVTTFYGIRPRQVRVIGSVLSKKTGLPLRGILIYFYDVNGAFVGTATTTADGSFRAAMPTTVARFQLFNDSIPTDLFRLVRFDSDLSATQSRPDYLNNFTTSGTAIPITVNSTTLAGMEYRRTGTTQECKPLLSTSTFDFSDYYLQTPILAISNDETDGTGSVIDPALVAEGCSVP